MDDKAKKLDASYQQYLSMLLNKYGTDVLSESYGGRWKEDLPNDVRNLLFNEKPYEIMEIVLRPEDPEGHHWCLEYYLLTADKEGNIVRAEEYEKQVYSNSKKI